MWTPIGADEQGVKTPWRRTPTELGLSEARGLERCAVTSLYASLRLLPTLLLQAGQGNPG